MVNIFVFLPERNICSTRNIQICCWIPIKWTKKPGMWWRQSGFTEKDLIDQTYSVIRIYRSQLRNILLIGDDQLETSLPSSLSSFPVKAKNIKDAKLSVDFWGCNILSRRLSSCPTFPLAQKICSVIVDEMLRLEITNKAHSLFA